MPNGYYLAKICCTRQKSYHYRVCRSVTSYLHEVQILSYHVVPGATLMAKDLTHGLEMQTMLANHNLTVRLQALLAAQM